MASDTTPNELQWGRDHLIAEMGVPILAVRPSTWLQWGRDHLIAEIAAEGFVPEA